MVLMALLGGIRNLFGPVLGALIVGYAVEFFKARYGDTQLHLAATGMLLGLVVLFMPDGIIPAVTNLVNRFRAPGRGDPRAVRGPARRGGAEVTFEPGLATQGLTKRYGG